MAATTQGPEGNVRSQNIAILRAEPIAKEAIGLRPVPPADGWSLVKVPGTMWAGFELDYLRLNLPLYRERKGEAREKLLQWVRSQIHKLWGAQYDSQACKNRKVHKEWRKRKKSIGDWFKNHGRNETEIKIPYWRGRVTFRSVMTIKKREQILDLADELSGGAKRGGIDGIWLGFYQKAVKQIKEGLSEKEKEDIRAEMVVWDKTTVPEPVQARQAIERGGKTVQKVHKMLFKSMGMWCVTLCMYYDEAGLPVQSMVDLNDKLTKDKCGVVKSFRSWNAKGSPKVADTWLEYIGEIVIPAEKPELLEDEVRKKVGAPKPPIVIERFPQGHTLIPDAHTQENQADKTLIIRRFMNAEYKLAKAGSVQSVPWQLLGANPNAFVDSKYIPDDIKLMDPEKMSGLARTRFLEHLRHRQAMGKPAFKFKQVTSNGVMQDPLYPHHMERPPVADCLPVHTVLPQSTGATDQEDNIELNDEELENYRTDYSSDPSTQDGDEQLPTPAPTSPIKPATEVITRRTSEDALPPPKRKHGRPRKNQVAETPAKTPGPSRPRGRPRKLIIESSAERSTSPQRRVSPSTPDGTPTPAKVMEKRPKPKPKLKMRDKGTLAREIRGLGIEVPGATERVLRSGSSPSKQSNDIDA